MDLMQDNLLNDTYFSNKNAQIINYLNNVDNNEIVNNTIYFTQKIKYFLNNELYLNNGEFIKTLNFNKLLTKIIKAKVEDLAIKILDKNKNIELNNLIEHDNKLISVLMYALLFKKLITIPNVNYNLIDDEKW